MDARDGGPLPQGYAREGEGLESPDVLPDDQAKIPFVILIIIIDYLRLSRISINMLHVSFPAEVS